MQSKFLFLMSIILIGFTSACNTQVKDNNITDITRSQGTAILKQENITVLDVRTPGEFQQGHVKGALSLNVHQPGFDKKIGALDRKGTYMVYCQSGRRSSQAVRLMSQMGFTKIYHLSSGANGGLPVR